ncbi:MAG: iron-siderophore ABC transporter substrate-binding protein [Burkholderiales bacterium]|nr:iron-siderophore ABC transporter substrate-binding protein [Anaerolineae bacterium]
MSQRPLILILTALLSLLAVLPVTAQDDFPVTIEHKFGSTIITEAPQRVISIGFTEHDALIALGVMPVAVRYWYGDETDAIFAWAEDEAQAIAGEQPIVLNMAYGTLNYEAILALNPDLITAVDSGITQDEYDALSQIAPVIAQSDEYIDFGTPWQDITLRLGAAVGKSAEAQTLVSELEELFAQAREQNPQFAGQNVAVAYSYDDGHSFGFYTDQDIRGRFFAQLDFVVPAQLVEIAGESFYADLSAERVDLLDQDLLIFTGMQFVEGGGEEVESDALIGQLDVVRDGRVVYIPEAYDDALQFSSVLSLEYALEGIVPEVQAAIGTNAAIQESQCADGLRPVTDAAGVDVCVPEDPQRVMALMESDLDALLALGITPIATTNGRGQPTPPRYLMDELEGTDIEIVGSFYSPNVESVLALAPDLILMGGFDDEAVLEQLRAIAPVVNTFAFGESWQSHFTRVAEVVNKQAEAESFLAHYAERAEAVRAALADNAEAQVSIVRWNPNGPGIMLRDAFSSRVLADIGLVRPENQQGEGIGHTPPLSLEDLGQIDADWLFIGTLAAEGDAVDVMNDALENPLYQALGAVQNEHVVFMDGSLWTSIGGPLAALEVLDDVAAAMALLPEATEAA